MTSELTPDQKKLFEALRTWRNKEAQRQDVPPYMIFQNDVLRDITQKMPPSMESLLQINGLSQRKINQYGRQLLSLVQNPDKADESIIGSESLSQIYDAGPVATGFTEGDVIPVTVLNKQVLEIIKKVFRSQFRQKMVLVEGEIHNIREYSESRIFFDLGDEDGVLTCRYNGAWPAGLAEGQHAVCAGTVGVSQWLGTQWTLLLEVGQIKPGGTGLLTGRKEKVRERLEQCGYFDAYRHRPLPRQPQRIGVIGAKSENVLEDLQRKLTAYPQIQWEFYPVNLVKVNEIVDALRRADAGGKDILILAATKTADLDVFDEPELVEAIADTKTPLLTLIGTAASETLCDLAADVSCPSVDDIAHKIRELWRKEPVSPVTFLAWIILVMTIALLASIAFLMLKRAGFF